MVEELVAGEGELDINFPPPCGGRNRTVAKESLKLAYILWREKPDCGVGEVVFNYHYFLTSLFHLTIQGCATKFQTLGPKPWIEGYSALSIPKMLVTDVMEVLQKETNRKPWSIPSPKFFGLFGSFFSTLHFRKNKKSCNLCVPWRAAAAAIDLEEEYLRVVPLGP